MFVRVAFKLDVDATARLNHMENQIVGAGRAASDPKPSSKLFEPLKSKRSRNPFTRTLLLGSLSPANLLLPRFQEEEPSSPGQQQGFSRERKPGSHACGW
jgi:hypothetical protein